MWGLVYEGCEPNGADEWAAVFSQGYENGGPNNEGKRIYASATIRPYSDEVPGQAHPLLRRTVRRGQRR